MMVEDCYPSNVGLVCFHAAYSNAKSGTGSMRVGSKDSHGDAVRGLIGRNGLIETVPPVLRRAVDPFPVPVRTLDLSTWRPSSSSALKAQRTACQL
jgi:hypothetical protein